MQLGDRPLHDHPAPVEDDGPVADQFHLVQQVRRQEDGGALGAQLADEFADVLHALRVEAAGGLVEHDDVGLVDERQGDAQALPHAVGEAAGLGVGPVEQPHHVEHLGDALLADLAVHLAEHAQVAPGGHVAVEHGVVHEAAQMAQRPLPVGGHFVVEHLRVAAGGVDEAEDHADGGGLAAAVGAEEAEHVAPADGDVQVVDGAQPLEVFGQPVSGQHHRPAFAALQALRRGVVELLSSHRSG